LHLTGSWRARSGSIPRGGIRCLKRQMHLKSAFATTAQHSAVGSGVGGGGGVVAGLHFAASGNDTPQKLRASMAATMSSTSMTSSSATTLAFIFMILFLLFLGCLSPSSWLLFIGSNLLPWRQQLVHESIESIIMICVWSAVTKNRVRGAQAEAQHYHSTQVFSISASSPFT